MQQAQYSWTNQPTNQNIRRQSIQDMEQKLAHKLLQMSQQMNFACHKKDL